MIISARELPELRHELISHPKTPEHFLNLYDMHRDYLEKSEGRISPARDYIGAAGQTFRTAPIHYVDQRFSQLVGAAASSMPPSPIALYDLPTPTGLIYFSEPLLDGLSQRPAYWIALWGLFDNEDHSECDIGLIVWWLIDRETKWVRSGLAASAEKEQIDRDSEAQAKRELLPRFCPSFACQVIFGDTRYLDDLTDPSPGSPYWMLRYLFATWHIQRQRLTTTRLVRPQRPAVRRLARAGDTTDPVVRVIALRTPESQSAGGTTTPHEYHHQWIVRGHWRQQWYPTISDNRPVWIPPHLKGPDGAPLLGGEKVYDWRR